MFISSSHKDGPLELTKPELLKQKLKESLSTKQNDVGPKGDEDEQTQRWTKRETRGKSNQVKGRGNIWPHFDLVAPVTKSALLFRE